VSESTPGEANEADVAEQQLSTTDDEEPAGPVDNAEVDPADAAEQTRSVTPDEDYPHDLESSVDEA
jgi:hypothetical protein